MNELMMPTPRITLNTDILLAILSLSPPKTATSIMATCRFLYHEGAKVILRWPIRLYGSERDLPILRFIQAEDLSRCSYVRKLSIIVEGYSEAVARVLVDIVPRMSALEYLLFRGEHLLRAFPYLLPAFASLRSVKTLVMAEVGDKSFELVRTLQSGLIVANIQFSAEGHGTLSFIASNHPVQLFQQWASTLQEVQCTHWHETHTSIHALLSSPQIVYPNVHSLILRTNGDAPCLSPYIRAFPNLIHLRVEVNFYHYEGSENQAQIDMTLQSLVKRPLVWRHLQTYTGTLPTLQALHIIFPIPRLYFTTLPHGSFVRRSRLAEAFAYARPTHLTIAFEDRAFSGFFCSDLLTALSSDGGSGLQSLSLTIEVMAADVDGGFDVGHFWSSIENIFWRLQLCSLDITMRDLSVPETASTVALAYSKADAKHRASFTLAERTLEDFAVHAFVGRLAASIPTLQHAVVSIERPSRWAGGIMRTARLGRHDDKPEKHADAVENAVLYEEYRVAPKRGGWAALTRTWYQGLNTPVEVEG